jgi:hypothetical protein
VGIHASSLRCSLMAETNVWSGALTQMAVVLSLGVSVASLQCAGPCRWMYVCRFRPQSFIALARIRLSDFQPSSRSSGRALGSRAEAPGVPARATLCGGELQGLNDADFCLCAKTDLAHVCVWVQAYC